MKSRKYLLVNFLTVMLGVPLLAGIFILLFPYPSDDFVINLAICLLLAVFAGAVPAWLSRRFTAFPVSFLTRYFFVLLAWFLLLCLWLVALVAANGHADGEIFVDIYRHFPFPYEFFFVPLSLVLNEEVEFSPFWELGAFIPLIPWGSFCSYAVVLAWCGRKQPSDRRGQVQILILMVSLSLIIAMFLTWQIFERRARLVEEMPGSTFNDDLSVSEYRPFDKANLLTRLSDSAELQIPQNWPHLNGASAFYPLYASAVQATYQNMEYYDVGDYVRVDGTPLAFSELMEGKADLIFTFTPSSSQMQRARKQGLSLMMRPFAREALVFVTHIDNPIHNLTEEQVRGIYSGRINNWHEIGGPDEPIFPYQRPEDSGSQTVMLNTVMKGLSMRNPLDAEVPEGMYDLIRRVANYQNRTNSLGYTFRFYATQMRMDRNIRFLSINGIAPTAENIRNGSYPFISDIYMITARNTSPQTQALIDWFLSTQGQQLVKDVGYVPLEEK